MIILNGTSGIRFPLSTAASPSVSNTTSSDTGIYYPTSTILGFATAGAEQMRIDSSGNVGIGTASGTARLSVNGGASTSQIRWEVSNSTYTQEVSTNAAQNAYVYKISDASFHTWKVSNSEAMRLSTAGYLGINLGGTNPADILDVYRSGQGNTGLSVRSNSGTGISLASNRGSGGNSPLTSAGDASIIYSAGAIDTGSLVIGQWSGSVRGIRLTSTGQVGVAQADPNSFAGSAPYTITVGTIRPVTLASGYGGNGIYGSSINFNSVIDTSISTPTFSIPSNTSQRGGASLAGYYDGSFLFYNYDAGSDSGGTRTINLSSALRMVLSSTGALSFGTTGTNFGTSGQVLTSQGSSAPPTWAAVSGIPTGGIIMWSGSVASIPSGWALCNGANGTPDLRDRFIVAAGSTYNPGDTGGSNDSTLPAHTHTFTGNPLGTHNHTTQLSTGGGGGPYYKLNGGGFEIGQIVTDSASAGTPTGSISSSGVSSTGTNRPPYYALAFIMKL